LQARRCFSRALQQNPNCVDALSGLGSICKAQANYREAVELYQRVIECSPEDGGAWAELAYCYLMLNELQQSYNSYQEALQRIQHPKSAHLWYGIGLLYNRYGSYSHALEAFDACLKLDPGFELVHEVRFRSAIIGKKQGRLDESLSTLHEVCVRSTLLAQLYLLLYCHYYRSLPWYCYCSLVSPLLLITTTASEYMALLLQGAVCIDSWLLNVLFD
jgi:tetratricopeptide (TPR) repeat protein